MIVRGQLCSTDVVIPSFVLRLVPSTPSVDFVQASIMSEPSLIHWRSVIDAPLVLKTSL
jgi:hypothetical protein